MFHSNTALIKAIEDNLSELLFDHKAMVLQNLINGIHLIVCCEVYAVLTAIPVEANAAVIIGRVFEDLARSPSYKRVGFINIHPFSSIEDLRYEARKLIEKKGK